MWICFKKHTYLLEEILCIVVLENGKSLSSCVHPIRYLNEPLLPYESILNNTIFSISTLSILIGILFLWKVFLLIQSSPKIIPCKYKETKLFVISFQLYNNLFWYSFIHRELFCWKNNAKRLHPVVKLKVLSGSQLL